MVIRHLGNCAPLASFRYAPRPLAVAQSAPSLIRRWLALLASVFSVATYVSVLFNKSKQSLPITMIVI